MNQAELIEQIAGDANLTKAQTQSALKAMLKAIMQKVADGDRVTLVGFGTFEAKARSERDGRNPRTGEVIHIPATIVPSFSAGKAFREAVNK